MLKQTHKIADNTSTTLSSNLNFIIVSKKSGKKPGGEVLLQKWLHQISISIKIEIKQSKQKRKQLKTKLNRYTLTCSLDGYLGHNL